MHQLAETFYDLLALLETGHTDSQISDTLGFPVDVIAQWRADAALDITQDF
jgi:hypothetical protein